MVSSTKVTCVPNCCCLPRRLRKEFRRTQGRHRLGTCRRRAVARRRRDRHRILHRRRRSRADGRPAERRADRNGAPGLPRRPFADLGAAGRLSVGQTLEGLSRILYDGGLRAAGPCPAGRRVPADRRQGFRLRGPLRLFVRSGRRVEKKPRACPSPSPSGSPARVSIPI